MDNYTYYANFDAVLIYRQSMRAVAVSVGVRGDAASRHEEQSFIGVCSSKRQVRESWILIDHDKAYVITTSSMCVSMIQQLSI